MTASAYKRHPSQHPQPHRLPALVRLLACGALLAVSAHALAQFIWIDDKGIKHLSDQPPPPSVPEQRILKAPGKPLFDPNAPPPAPADGETAAAEPKAKAPPTLVERNADYDKRQAEAAKKAKSAGEEAARKASAAANCDGARNNQRALDEGIRLTTYDKDGNRIIMDDAQRSAAATKNQKTLADCH
ncbi:DUF4124 domain-containing protein [Rugamonas sp.]|uniref:DUF4124 domain-containing protein n=1 Tax=Rugamonas sp. TaxID=1926287 RepID=UPI0025D3CA79|nr:DUF4124 domain-containing protein [Rugamonas sp.]